MVRNDFAVFILTHGRADEMLTLDTLRAVNYTGRWYMVIDDEDGQRPQYEKNFGKEHIIVFSKEETAKYTDAGDNLPGRTAILWARNASFGIAKDLGLKYFQMLDDDYTGGELKYTNEERSRLFGRPLKCYDDCVEMAIRFLDTTDAMAVAFAQGGDWIGGVGNPYSEAPVSRKCMNTFICRTDKPFKFFGRMNEDVSTYVRAGMLGLKMFSIMPIMVHQAETQKLGGGMSEEYKDGGTYQKTFYSVMYAPSAVKVSTMRSNRARVHHSLCWRNIAAKIIDEKYKK